jgi:hypothetical protein
MDYSFLSYTTNESSRAYNWNDAVIKYFSFKNLISKGRLWVTHDAKLVIEVAGIEFISTLGKKPAGKLIPQKTNMS